MASFNEPYTHRMLNTTERPYGIANDKSRAKICEANSLDIQLYETLKTKIDDELY